VVNLKVTNVRLSENILADTDELAKKHGLNRSEIIRQALTVYLHLVDNVGTMLRPIAFQVKPSQIGYMRRGDVSILKVPTGHAIVVGSTSSGGVGPKAMDSLKVQGRVVGNIHGSCCLDGCCRYRRLSLLLSATLRRGKRADGREILDGIRGRSYGAGA
jgi:hypothetical protein